jgi:hypothetical protein
MAAASAAADLEDTMRNFKVALLLALVGFGGLGLSGCVFEEDRDGYGHGGYGRGGYEHGGSDRGGYDHRWR